SGTNMQGILLQRKTDLIQIAGGNPDKVRILEGGSGLPNGSRNSFIIGGSGSDGGVSSTSVGGSITVASGDGNGFGNGYGYKVGDTIEIVSSGGTNAKLIIETLRGESIRGNYAYDTVLNKPYWLGGLTDDGFF